MRAELIGHFKACMTEIYLHTVARMADYIRTHPYVSRPVMCVCGGCVYVCVCGAEHVRDGQATLADFAHGDYPESGSKTMGGPSALERVLGHVKAAL